MAHGSDLPNPYTFCLRLNLCAMGEKKQKKFFLVGGGGWGSRPSPMETKEWIKKKILISGN